MSVYMPCDTYLVNTVNSEFVDIIDNILHSYDFNHIIITGDFNTCFSRDNAQSKCLSEFLVRGNLFVSWKLPSAKRGNTYNNLSLGHHSFIENVFVSKNIFDCITINIIVDMSDGINPSMHSIILLSFKFIMNVIINTYQNCSIINSNCLWDKANIADIDNYNNALNRFLGDIDIYCELFTCTN